MIWSDTLTAHLKLKSWHDNLTWHPNLTSWPNILSFKLTLYFDLTLWPEILIWRSDQTFWSDSLIIWCFYISFVLDMSNSIQSQSSNVMLKFGIPKESLTHVGMHCRTAFLFHDAGSALYGPLQWSTLHTLRQIHYDLRH